ncbi:MAG: hypothetical protein ABR558_11045 [Thioalkalivibrio sp.]
MFVIDKWSAQKSLEDKNQRRSATEGTEVTEKKSKIRMGLVIVKHLSKTLTVLVFPVTSVAKNFLHD